MTIDNLTLTTQWDKVFPQSEGVDHEKVTFHNRFGIRAMIRICGWSSAG